MDRLRSHALAFNVVAVAIATIVAAALYLWWDNRRERDDSLERGYVAAELVALSLNEHAVHSFDMARGLLDILDEMVRERGGPSRITPAMHEALARELYGVESAYQTLMVLAPSGQTLATSWSPRQAMPDETHEGLTKPFREDPKRTEASYSHSYMSAVSGEQVVAITKGYHESDGRLTAVLGVTVRLSHFQRAYDRIRSASGAPQALSLFDNDAHLLARSPRPTVGDMYTALPGSKENLDRGLAAPKGRLRLVAPRDHVERIAVLRRVGDYPFAIGVSTRVDELMAPAVAHGHTQTAAIVAGGLLVLLFSALLARHAFLLSRSQRLMRLATEGVGVGIWDTDLRNEKVQRSDEMLAMLGIKRTDSVAMVPKLLVELVHPDDFERLDDFRRKIRDGRREATRLEFRARMPDGSYRWFETTAVAVDFVGDKPLRLAGTLVDVDERRRAQDAVQELASDLERKVEERTRELEVVVRELESFSYSVSHDLRAPVRHVAAFGKLAQDALASGELETARTYLERALNAGTRMDTVIQHLLRLARVGRTQPQPVPIKLSSIAAAVVKRLREAEPERTATITIDPGLTAKGDPGLTEIAIENLLSNAWKFTRPRGAAATIEFGLANASGVPEFYVRDNGVGFDPGRAERLFHPFTRLHSESEFEGTGIGLATVKRALERQGGTIRAESTPGVGTTFYFTLPVK